MCEKVHKNYPLKEHGKHGRNLAKNKKNNQLENFNTNLKSDKDLNCKSKSKVKLID